VELVDDGAAKALSERLEAERLGEGLQKSFGDRLIVSGDGPDVLVYAGQREQADAAAEAIRAIAGEHGWDVELELKRWHPEAEEWEDPEKPLPTSDAERAAEHARLIERERDETAERGYAEYEVKVHCSSHRDTVKLADWLREEGLPIAQRWKYLLVGASDEDAANALAERLRAEAPPGATVTAEVSQRVAWDDDPGRGSFAMFGGLGG
ncbi:MAG: hypothetical protein JO286_01130, partial [Solirubrobacterales bacterium]|nr:hypothetical protein [Solirubrobacterales bacterium]